MTGLVGFIGLVGLREASFREDAMVRSTFSTPIIDTSVQQERRRGGEGGVTWIPIHLGMREPKKERSRRGVRRLQRQRRLIPKDKYLGFIRGLKDPFLIILLGIYKGRSLT